MITKIVELTNGPNNWGKILLGRFTLEWEYRSAVDIGKPLLRARGHVPTELVIFDLQTREGAIFVPGGMIRQLHKHKIWVCPMFEPFIAWLDNWIAEGKDAMDVPALVDMPDAEFSIVGYRRGAEPEPVATWPRRMHLLHAGMTACGLGPTKDKPQACQWIPVGDACVPAEQLERVTCPDCKLQVERLEELIEAAILKVKNA